jgi:hypothetical protein
MPQTLALFLSIAIEAVVAFAAMRMLSWGSGGRAALAATAGTLVTHPLVWHAVPRLEPALGYAAALLLSEVAVVLAESVAYRVLVPVAWPRSLAISLLANLASTGAGLACYALAG